MIRFRRCLALLALAGTACEMFTDPRLPPGTTVLTPPPVYARWWAMTEACSGRHRDMSAITWYVVTDSESISAGSKHDLGGYYSSVSDRIVLADTANLPGSVIRHEMLHALLGPLVHGHPRDAFLGSCAGTVACIGSCITNAGPPPSFSWVATCLRAIQLCGNLGYEMRDERANDMASATRFAPGETKRFVVDFQVGRTADASWSLPAGPYAFTGYYGGRYPGLTRSTPDTAMVGP